MNSQTSMPTSANAAPAQEGARDHEGSRRIALVISSLGPGGAERVVCALAKSWSRGGHDVSVVTVGLAETDSYDLAPGVRRVALGLARRSRNVLEGGVQASRRVAALRSVLLGLEPDVVVSFLERTNVLSLVATLRTGLPVIVSERSDPWCNRIGTQWRVLRRLLYPRAAAVVVQTERAAAWAREFCSRVHVIPNFVERPHWIATPGTDRGPRRLMAMGRLAPEKGFDLLIEAFARIASSHPDWSLTILGEGPERENLERLVGSLHLEHRVSMPGRVDDPLPHLAAGHGFALPSRFEGFPNALLEAMACGLPVVAFDCPSGPADIVTHERNGFLVKAGDVSRLADALSRTMGNSAERVRMGQNARDIAIRLSPERILERWNTLLRRAGA